MKPSWASTAIPAMTIPSMSMKGSPSMSIRSANVPLSPSSALQVTNFGEPGLRDLVADLLRGHRQRPPQGEKSTVRQVVLGGQRVDDADPAEGQAVLLREPGNLVGGALAELVRIAVEEAGSEEAGDVVRHYRAVGHPTPRAHHLDQWLEPHHPARAVANDLDRCAQSGCLQLDGHHDLVGTNGAGRGVPGDIDGGHVRPPLTSALLMTLLLSSRSRSCLLYTSDA